MTHNHDATASAANPSVMCPASQPHHLLLPLYLYTNRQNSIYRRFRKKVTIITNIKKNYFSTQ